MPKYLGELPLIEVCTPVKYALLFIEKCGQIDDKQWALDQVARILLGTPVVVTLARWDDGQTEKRYKTMYPPSAAYAKWVDDSMGAVVDAVTGERAYDEGIAPSTA